MRTGRNDAGARLAPTGLIALVLASVLWGTTGTAASFLPDTVSPVSVGAATMGIGGVLLLLVSARAAWATFRTPGVTRWIVLGAAGVAVYPLSFYSSMSLAGVAVGNVVTLGSGPVFAALLERGIEHRRLSRRWVLATAVAVIGIALLGLGGHGGRADDGSGTASGILLGLLGGLAYATYTYASSRAIADGRGSRSVMGAVFGLGAVVLIPILLLSGGPLLGSVGSIAIVGYLAIGPMFVAYLLFGVGLRTLRSSIATTVTLLEPVVATLLAVVIVGERLDPVGWAGLALVLAGLLVLVLRSGGPAPRLS